MLKTNAQPEFINREISWLKFNQRVLQEAADPTTPLIERLKFLGIFSNNQDEFFRVRVATLSRMSDFNEKQVASTMNDPVKVLKEINEIIFDQQKQFIEIYWDILSLLEQKNIFILNETQLDEKQGAYINEYFHEQVRPNLFPIMISHFEHSTALKDKSIYLAVCLRKKDKKTAENYALIKVPVDSVSRFLILPKTDDRTCIILLDDIIRYCLKDIFRIFGYDTFEAYTIKFTRDAELDIDNDVSKSFMQLISESLKQRSIGRPVRFIFDRTIPAPLLKILIKKFKITHKDDLIGGGRYHNFKDFINFPNVGSPDLEYPVKPALHHKDLPHSRSLFSSIKEKDIMLHFPYQSFDYMIDLLREASIDPKVKSIKMTLYRLAKNSNIINALVNAARNGKEVTVYLELQARFDERANIEWSQKLLEEGAKIIHGQTGRKVHAKLLLIKRREGKKDVSYSNIGTGNFNEESARIFADDSLFTCNPDIASDVEKVFSLFVNNYEPMSFKSLIVSPFYMRQHFTRMLETEISNARAGKKAWVILKLNSLVDENIARKLYEASEAGVNIKIIVRGSCILKAGKGSFSDKIEAISIVDKFLEHSRVLIFYNGGDEKYFISSADWMTRNFDHRVEVACPIFDKSIQKEIKDMIKIQLKDNVKARCLNYNKYNQYKSHQGKKEIRSQYEIYEYLKRKLEIGN